MKVVQFELAFFLSCLTFVSNTNAVITKNYNPSKRSILDQLSPAALDQLLVEIKNIESNSDSKCTSRFNTMNSQIIRTQDSLKRGATFLHALPDVSSASKCRDECCSYSTNRTGILLKCNVGVFQAHKTDSNPRCFLFDCYNQTSKNFICLFAANADFTSFKANIPRLTSSSQIKELNDVAKTTSITTTTSTTKQTTTTIKTTTPATSKLRSTTITTTTSKPTTTIASTLANDPNSCSATKCQRMEWQCDNKCCVPLKNVCDSIRNCLDGSDEIGCPTNFFKSTTSKNTASTSSILVTTTTKTITLLPSSIKVAKEAILTNPKQVDNQKSQNQNDQNKSSGEAEPIDPEAGAVLPLAIGLAVTAMVLIMVACRIRIMKRKLRRRGKPLTMDESDYLINGMYL